MYNTPDLVLFKVPGALTLLQVIFLIHREKGWGVLVPVFVYRLGFPAKRKNCFTNILHFLQKFVFRSSFVSFLHFVHSQKGKKFTIKIV